MAWPSLLRYIFLGTHFVLWIIGFGVGFASTGNLALLGLNIMIGIACLVYCPAAIVLAIIDSPSRFTQAGGEVGYLVVQQVQFFSSGLAAAVFGSNTVCTIASDLLGESRSATCGGFRGAAAIYFIQFFMLIAWMAMVIHTARHTPGMDTHEAFKIATHQLMAGSYGGGNGRTKAKNVEGGGYGGEMGMVEGKKGLTDYRQDTITSGAPYQVPYNNGSNTQFGAAPTQQPNGQRSLHLQPQSTGPHVQYGSQSQSRQQQHPYAAPVLSANNYPTYSSNPGSRSNSPAPQRNSEQYLYAQASPRPWAQPLPNGQHGRSQSDSSQSPSGQQLGYGYGGYAPQGHHNPFEAEQQPMLSRPAPTFGAEQIKQHRGSMDLGNAGRRGSVDRPRIITQVA